MTPLPPNEIDRYISAFPQETRELLNQLRSLIREAAPEAKEVISYRMPAFKIYGRILLYFAGYNKHIGFYPGASGIATFYKELSGFKWAKGSVQFPLDKPLPLDLITRIVLFRVNENLQKGKTKIDKIKQVKSGVQNPL